MQKQTKQLFIYFSLTLILTWLLWLPSVLNAQGYEMPPILMIIGLPANFTPAFIGLLLHKKEHGKSGFRTLLKQKFTLDFKKIWLLILPLFFFITAGLSYFVLMQMQPDFEAVQPVPYVMAPLVFLQIFFIGGALGEEYGWRGYAYPKLKAMMHPLLATLILGLIWSIWHLPLFYMAGTVQSNLPLWQFMLQNTMIAFYYTWLFHRTKGSLWMMIYLHAIANTASAIFPTWQSEVGRFLNFGVLALGLVVLYVVWPLKKAKTESA